MKKYKVAISFAIALTWASSAQAMTVYDPTNYAANLETKLQMIEQVRTSTLQLQADMKNLQKLDMKDLNLSYNLVKDAIQTMETLRKQTDAIGTDYTKLNNEWSELNPDYNSWNGVSADQYTKIASKLRGKWGDVLLQALQMSGITSNKEQMKTENAMKKLLDASQNAEGSMGALQVSNQLIAMMISEQQKLQALVAESLRTQSMYQQSILDAEKRGEKINKDFNKNNDKYKNHQIKNNTEQLHQFK